MVQRTKALLLVLLFLASVAGSAHAVILTPGVFTPLSGTTAAANPNLAGPIVYDDMVAFSFIGDDTGGIISGQVQVRLVHAVDNTYDFYWRVINDANSAGAIGSFRIGEFMTSVYDADYRIDGVGDKAPQYAYLFPDPPYAGYVNFEFGTDGLAAGMSSNFMFLDTLETTYPAGFALYDVTNVGQTHISGQFTTPAPGVAVPEPSMMVLFFSGLAGLAGFGWHFRK